MNLIMENVMLTKEKIKDKAECFGKLAPAFLEGAKYALTEQWVSIDEDKPWNHAELIDKNYCFQITKLIIVKYKNNSVGCVRIKAYEGEWKCSSDITHWLSILDLTEEED